MYLSIWRNEGRFEVLFAEFDRTSIEENEKLNIILTSSKQKIQ